MYGKFAPISVEDMLNRLSNVGAMMALIPIDIIIQKLVKLKSARKTGGVFTG